MKIKNNLIKVLLAVSLLVTGSYAKKVMNLDSGELSISIKNNKANVLNFPFTVAEAKIATADEKDFSIKAKGDSIVIIPSVTSPSTRGDLIIWSKDGYTYLFKVDVKGAHQFYDFTSNRVKRSTKKTAKFESGKVDTDIKKLIKKVMTKNNIPGYKKVKVKRQFNTEDLLMQKDYIFDGSKYRVEKWFLKNKTNMTIKLDEANIYTKGIIGISFEPATIPSHKIGVMYLIVNKSTIEAERGN